MKNLLLTSLLLAASSAAFAAPAVNGAYTVHISVAGNENDQPCTFTAQDATLTGTCKSMDGKDIAVTGTVDGNKVSWKYDMEFNGSTLTMTYTATVDDAAKFSGSVDVQPFNVTGEFTATAAAPAPAAAPAATAAPATAGGLNGTFNVHTSVAGHDSDQPCTFTAKDAALTGTCKSMDGKDVPITGSIDGKKATWKFDIDFNGTALTLTYSATLDDPAKIAGSVDVAPFNMTGDFTATPAKDAK